MTAPVLDKSREAFCEGISTDVMRTCKLLRSVRRFTPAVHAAVESAHVPLLFELSQGDRSVSELADAVYSDVSTVSRQVSHLVENGLVRKGPGVRDRRVQVLSCTPVGERVVGQLKVSSASFFSGLLDDWDPADVATFSEFLRHFVTNLESAHERLAEEAAGA